MTLARKGDVAIFGEVSIGFPRMELRRAGHSVELTFLEFKLLKFFIGAPERIEIWRAGLGPPPACRALPKHSTLGKLLRNVCSMIVHCCDYRLSRLTGSGSLV